MTNFTEKFAAYTNFFNSMNTELKNFISYEDYTEANPAADLSPADFIRYKNNFRFTETQYWNMLVDKENITKKYIKNISFDV